MNALNGNHPLSWLVVIEALAEYPEGIALTTTHLADNMSKLVAEYKVLSATTDSQSVCRTVRKLEEVGLVTCSGGKGRQGVHVSLSKDGVEFSRRMQRFYHR